MNCNPTVIYRRDLEGMEQAAKALAREVRRLRRQSKKAGEKEMIAAAHKVSDELIEWMSMHRHPSEK